MGAINVQFWGSMTPQSDGSPLNAEFTHQGTGIGSYRATVESVKQWLDEIANQLEEMEAKSKQEALWLSHNQ